MSQRHIEAGLEALAQTALASRSLSTSVADLSLRYARVPGAGGRLYF